MFLTFLFQFSHRGRFVLQTEISGKNLVFLNKYISVILAFVVYSIKLVTSAVGISLPSVFYSGNSNNV